MNFSLQIVIKKYAESDRDNSPTLNSLYICATNIQNASYDNFLSSAVFNSLVNVPPNKIKEIKDKKLSQSEEKKLIELERINYLNSNKYIIYEYLKDIIDNEIVMSKKGYYTFYTAQSLVKYINSRVLDYLLASTPKPSYFLWKGDADIDNKNNSLGGKYNNLFEYMQFFRNNITNIINTEGNKTESLLDKYNTYAEMFDKPKLTTQPTPKELDEINKKLVNFGMDPITTDKTSNFMNIMKQGKSFDSYDTEIAKNLYSVNNTGLGNSLKNEDVGESTVKFFQTKYNESIFKKDDFLKFLKKDLVLYNNIDSKIFDDFSNAIEDFLLTYIMNPGSIYPTNLAILYKISIKKEELYKHFIPTIAYALPINLNIPTLEYYNGDYKNNINGLYENIFKKNMSTVDNYKNLLQYDNKIEDYQKFIKNKYNFQKHCDFLTELQGRLVLTEDWKKAIKTNNIVISVFPCNYNSEKKECEEFVTILDNIIEKFANLIKPKNKTTETNEANEATEANKKIKEEVLKIIDDIYKIKEISENKQNEENKKIKDDIYKIKDDITQIKNILKIKDDVTDFKSKYIKYKNRYISLKNKQF
jgi:hypothetical protein